ncbi:MAG: CheR family methyltransferase [Hormoscilla sp.]
MPSELTQELLQQFTQLIANYTGWRFRAQDQPSVSEKIAFRCQALKLSGPEAYYQLLSSNSNDSQREWQQLALLLTIGETYFFRDRGVFDLLRDRLLPELISRNSATRSLAIYSAGCSTGEEAYSLAIMLAELLPDLPKWRLFILGTDINQVAIAKAQRGIYGPWSFRAVPPEIQQRYFRQVDKHTWQLDDRIRRLVTFRYENLLSHPQDNLYSLDLILCRNVFVYFTPDAIATVLNKFCNLLKPDGYLIPGHNELYGHNLGNLVTRVFPESVVYQRPITSQFHYPHPRPHSQEWDYKNKAKSLRFFGQAQPSAQLSNRRHGLRTPSKPTTDVLHKTSDSSSGLRSTDATLDDSTYAAMLQAASNLFRNKHYPEALQTALELLELHPEHFATYHLIARVYANLGDLTQALKYCQLALSVNPLSTKIYSLLAHIAEEQGNIEDAKMFWKRIIYLNQTAVSAYIELGSLYAKEGDRTRSTKMWTVALDLLKKLPERAIVEEHCTMTAGELLPLVAKRLAN